MSANANKPHRRSLRRLIAAIAGFLILTTTLAQAQITLDGSLGPAGALTGPNFVIPSTVGQTRSGNLFHSFGLFNVLTNQSATFTGPNSVSNILGRVTAGQPSTIDGQIRSTIPNANLYLMNPAGMLFGPNASLDVQGSFHATTADYLKFADGAKFHADLARESVLTTAPVSAFGFLSQNPAGISIQGSSLQVPDGQTLSLVGGDLFIAGEPSLTSQGIATLAAPGGKIQLASVASPGEVPLNIADTNLAGFSRLGNINVADSLIDASGDANGSVVIRGGRLFVNGSLIFADTHGDLNGAATGIDVQVTEDIVVTNGSFITTDVTGAGKAGNIKLTADSVEVSNSALIASRGFSTGDSGDIVIEAKNVTLTGGASISSNTSDAGKGGTVRVTASDTIALAGVDSSITASSESGSTGDAGDVVVAAKNVTLTGGANIRSETSGSGKGGTVRVTATDTITLTDTTVTLDDFRTGIFADASSTGNSGDIVIEAKNVTLTGRAGISSDTKDAGNAGTVRVTASDAVRVDGLSFISARSFVGPSNGGGTGVGGNIVVEAKNVALTGGAGIKSDAFGSGKGGTVRVTATDTVALDGADTQISASTDNSNMGGGGGDIVVEAKNLALTGGARISSDTFGSGKGGTVRVTATHKIFLTGASPDGDGSSISSRSFGDGAGGSVEVRASQVNLNDQASISAKSSGSGNAGDINIQANEFRSANSSVTTQADFADGGNIHLTVVKLVYLLNSQITASVGTENGSGGNITIEPQFVVLNNSHITANAFGGPGGNITIVADNFLASPDSTITASSALSTPGTVNIQAPITDLSGSLAPLPESIVQATSLLRQSCATRYSSGKLSSLASSGRGGMPFEPGGFMPSPLSKSETSTAQSSNETKQTIYAELRPPFTPRFSINAGCF